MIGPRRYLRELLPLLENRPPTRSARLARKSQRLCVQAPSSPGRAGDIRSQSACRDVPRDSTIGRCAKRAVEQVRLSRVRGRSLAMSTPAPNHQRARAPVVPYRMQSFEQKADNPPALPKPSFGASSARAEPRQRPQVTSATASAAKSRGPGPYPRRRKRALAGYLVALSGEFHSVRGRCGPNSLWTGEPLR